MTSTAMTMSALTTWSFFCPGGPASKQVPHRLGNPNPRLEQPGIFFRQAGWPAILIEFDRVIDPGASVHCAVSSSFTLCAGAAVKIVTVVGARPQFIKAAVVSRAVALHNQRRQGGGREIEELIVHTGQHFDDNMS